MRRWFPIRARRLHGRRLISHGRTIERATLFPFFDRAGQAEYVLVVDPDSPELHTFRLPDVELSIPLFGTDLPALRDN